MEGDSGVVHFINQQMAMATVTEVLTDMGMARMVMELLLVAMAAMGILMAVGMALMGPRTK